MSRNEISKEYKVVRDLESEDSDIQRKYGYGVRHIQLALILLCLTVNIIGRGHMGVSIVAMTDISKIDTKFPFNVNTTRINHTEDLLNTLTKPDLEDKKSNHLSLKNQTTEKFQHLNFTYNSYNKFKWPKSVQEMVLNSFFLGYSIMMFPMGIICQRYGGKLPLQIALLVNGIVSVVTPWLTSWGDWKAVCVCRILQGLSQAGTYPSVQAQLSKWASVTELATLSSYVYTGTIVGTVVAYQLAGVLGESTWGWPSTFYTFGVISLTSFLLLTIFGATSPAEHKTISDEEKEYIMGSPKNGQTRITQQRLETPWRAMVASKPLWGVLAAQIGSNTSFIFFFNQVPSYIHSILGINVKNSGMLSSLPYIASFFTSIAFGWISDYLTNKKLISLKNARRIFSTIALCGLAVALVCASYTHNSAVAVSCLVFAMATHVAVHTSWMINHIDLSPNFSGTVMATCTTLGMFFVLSTPVIISYIITDTTNVIQWRIMFFIIAGFCFLTNTIFIVLVSTDIQPWNYPEFNEKCSGNTKDVICMSDELKQNKTNEVS